jgi:tetratricopeptide (TPR) repeat protein
MNRIKRRFIWVVVILGAVAALVFTMVLFSPHFSEVIQSKVNHAFVYIRGIVIPAGQIPTAEPTENFSSGVTSTPSQPIFAGSPTSMPKNLPAQTPEILPRSTLLTAPKFDPKQDYQDWNNCGPATLALALRMFGWEGDQNKISDVIKPVKQDKNVNIEELRDYVNQYTNPIRAVFRVGGDLETLKKYIAAGFPVIIEESFQLTESFWPADDWWAAHYLLLTGYDDNTSSFVSQDSFYGPNRVLNYSEVSDAWRSFNHVYMVLFPSEHLNTVKVLMGEDWSETANRQRTVKELKTELRSNPEHAFTWFNLGSNLVYLDQFLEASEAFTNARRYSLPQRMLRYQFGPFIAAYETHQTDDLNELLDYSLKITPDSEEALLWKGWAMVQTGDKQTAIEFFRKALTAHPGYSDAIKAIKFVTTP